MLRTDSETTERVAYALDMVAISRGHKKVGVQGVALARFRRKPELNVGEGERQFGQLVQRQSCQELLIALNREVVRDPQDCDCRRGAFETSKVGLPVVTKAVLQRCARTVEMRIPAVPFRGMVRRHKSRQSCDEEYGAAGPSSRPGPANDSKRQIWLQLEFKM